MPRKLTFHSSVSKYASKKPPLIVGVKKNIAERQGFEPWQRLHVDRLAICSITTLAPLQNGDQM